MMRNVNTQIQRAISDAISNQILPQIQTALNPVSGHLTQSRWDVPSERPEINSEETYGEKVKKNTRCERRIDNKNDGQPRQRTYGIVTWKNGAPIDVPEFLTGLMPSRSHLHRSYDDLNPLLDTTIQVQERTVPAPEQDPINRLAEVLTSMQNRPTAQQLTICPFNSNILTFDGRSE